MTSDIKRFRQRLTGAKPTRHEVGYAKPPVATRFQKGQSGNPRGRPKGSKSKLPRLNEERLKDIILKEAYRTIKVHEGEQNITLSMAEAVIRSIAVGAAKGQPSAQRLFTRLLSATETAHKRLADEWLQTAIEYKAGWEKEFERLRSLGLPIPEPIPHPDHIEINMATGEVIVKGPHTLEEKARWDKMRKRKRDVLEEINLLRKELGRTKEVHRRQLLEQDLERAERLYAEINAVIKD